MREVDIDEAAGRLSELLKELAVDGELFLTRKGEHVAKLSPVPPRRRVQLGRAQGEWSVSDDFDAPLPDDLLDLSEGKRGCSLIRNPPRPA